MSFRNQNEKQYPYDLFLSYPYQEFSYFQAHEHSFDLYFEELHLPVHITFPPKYKLSHDIWYMIYKVWPL
jgi:hypothetical protein